MFEALRRQLRADALHRLLVEYLLALGGMTMVSVAAGWLLAGRALRPLRHITATARRVSGENLGERIGLTGPADELKELADTFDGMLGRLDGAFASQRHFVANASHELRTPLAIMRTEVDVALGDPDAPASELRAMGEALRETIDRCERLIDGLLFLARSEAAAGREEPVDMAALAGDCITDLHAHGGAGAGAGARRPGAGVDPRAARADRADDRQPARERDPPQRPRRLPGCHHGRAGGPHVGRGVATAARGSTRTTPRAWSSRSAAWGETAAGSGWACRSCARWRWRTAAR